MVVVILENGKRYCGDLWCWRHREGWFSLAGDNLPDRFFIKEVSSAVNKGVRTHPGVVEDVDLIEKAKKECSEDPKT